MLPYSTDVARPFGTTVPVEACKPICYNALLGGGLVVDRFMKVVAKAVRCRDEEHLKSLAVPFVDAPIPHLDTATFEHVCFAPLRESGQSCQRPRTRPKRMLDALSL
jgi:hypothetical protein